MALLIVDREQFARAAMLDADRQLVRYISETLAPLLPRLPTQLECIEPFVKKAGREAIDRGFGEGSQYSFHILTDLLLGPYWERHPFYTGRFEKYLDAPGMEQGDRITLATNAVIDARVALEAVLPGMLDAAIESLNIHPKRIKPADIWNTFQHIAHARGFEAHHVLPLFEQYEAGFRKANGLPAIQRKTLSGAVELAYTAQGIPLPQPSDDIRDLTPHQLMEFNVSLLLALIYGPYFHGNLLISKLLRIIKSPDSNIYQGGVKDFLLSHRRALTENTDE